MISDSTVMWGLFITGAICLSFGIIFFGTGFIIMSRL